MSSRAKAAALLACGLAVITNLYWISRVRTIERGLETAREWGETPPDRRSGGGENGYAGSDGGALYEAAEKAGVDPDVLPDEIERLRTRLDERDDEVELLRERWAKSWWDALQRRPFEGDGPHVVAVALPDATSETARSVAREALARDRTIALVTALGDGSFAVGVGEAMATEYSATDVAAMVVDELGRGGHSGTERLASGGGADGETTAAAASAVADRIDDRQ